MAKPKARQAARQLRQQDGLSIKEIAEKLGAARSSVSVWVRDIDLTPQQQARLDERNKYHPAQRQGSHANKAKHRELREQYQQEGRLKARESDLLHSWGCMLYWAEGTKSRNVIGFANSDTDMMVLFIKFLRDALSVPEEIITIRINCYVDCPNEFERIKQHWLEALDLEETQIRKCTINNRPKSSHGKANKLPYGVCRIEISSTKHLQYIYGAIQEYSGCSKPDWLD
ncbi:MAG: helix-turn-helix transcriptional regulator [Anaerolineaceae bacterium]|nr:helix-turn-helix transcriptional regulator [Anaerolineaceae bacterium]